MRPATDTPAAGTAPACHELLHLAREEAGGWDALAALVPANPRTGLRRPTVSRLKQMAGERGISRISDPDTLDGMAAMCRTLPSADRLTLDAWVAAQRETLRRRGLELPTVAQVPMAVTLLPAARRRTLLERAVHDTLTEVDTTGLTREQVDAVTGLIRHLAGGTRHRRGA